MGIKFLANFNSNNPKISRVVKLYRRNRDDLDLVSQEHKLTALDLFILNELENWRSCNQLFTIFHQKHGKKVLLKNIQSRTKYLQKNGLIEEK